MDRYVVIGNPVAHSQSPFIHREFALQTKQNMQYNCVEAPLDSFAKTISTLQKEQIKGANITLPFKQQAFAISDTASDIVCTIEAANTLVFNNDGSIYADNTDGAGLIQDLTHNHQYSVRQKKILLLGAGGAARGILIPLLNLAPAQLIIANRTRNKAVALAETVRLKGSVMGVGLDEIELFPFDLIINATSAGYTGAAITLNPALIGAHTWCYDLMYGKQSTPFFNWAQDCGAAQCLDGLGMLVEQAACAFYLWRGIYPETQAVIEKLKTRINKGATS